MGSTRAPRVPPGALAGRQTREEVQVVEFSNALVCSAMARNIAREARALPDVKKT